MRAVIRSALLRILLGGVALAVGPAGPALAVAQDLMLADRAPRFLTATSTPDRPIEVDVSAVPLLTRRVALRLDAPTVGTALAAITRQTGIRFAYSARVLPLDRPVSLQAENITVAAALLEILMNTGIDVMLSAGNRLALVKRASDPDRPQVGTITGRVTDATTGEGVSSVDVRVLGTQLSVTTTDGGGYTLRDVPAGEQRVTARRIGYRPQTQTVTVVHGEAATLDFALVDQPTQLDEVVTTVTGEQRLRELGHVVGRINADSLVKEAPVSSVSDLLMGRMSGVQVFQSQGTVGGEVKLQVRGPNSINLSTEPIVIVDGVRYASNAVPRLSGLGPALTESTSPLNDLNPNDIESIEVVKGPSAATLYGTDATNGVIVITTKRGQAGPPRWNAYARVARTSIPTEGYPDMHWAYGTTPTGAPYSGTCLLLLVAEGFCTQDSVVTVPSPLNDPERTIFGTQPRQEAGLSVAGGNAGLRYYFAVGAEDATGPVVMPRAALQALELQRGTTIPDEWRNPNTRSNLSLRANVAAQLGETGELSVHTGYIQGETQSLALLNPYATGIVNGTPSNPYGRYESKPEEVFAGQSMERADRFVGSATAQWRPVGWLLTRATLGLDWGTRHRTSLARRGDIPSSFLVSGTVSDDRARQLATTADLNVTATARRGRLSARTSVGMQYVRTLTDILANSGLDLPPGGSSVPEAATRFSSQSYTETVTLGSYVEETIGLNDRLFLTGALRVDGASAFGQNYEAVVYPKVSASWLASEEPFFPRVPGLDELRLRYAYGASGQQPEPAWARSEYAPSNSTQRGFLNDAPATVIRLTALGNPDIRPERVREHEFGFDATGLEGRVSLGLTWYYRRTVDQLVSTPLGVGYGSIFTNLGLTKQHGFEVELTAHLLDTRVVSWDVMARHSLHRTRLVDLGGASERRTPYGSYVEGYPLVARFQPVLEYGDANVDGILGFGELVNPSFNEKIYAGESVPPIAQALTTMLGFFDQQLRLSALVERRAGFTQVDGVRTERCRYGSCLAQLDPSTSIEQQALAEAARSSGLFAFLAPGDYTRLREVTVALDLPSALLSALRVRSATVSLSGRNLALWTDFSGGDPESSRTEINDAGGIPQGRTWTVRLDVGF